MPHLFRTCFRPIVTNSLYSTTNMLSINLITTLKSYIIGILSYPHVWNKNISLVMQPNSAGDEVSQATCPRMGSFKSSYAWLAPTSKHSLADNLWSCLRHRGNRRTGGAHTVCTETTTSNNNNNNNNNKTTTRATTAAAMCFKNLSKPRTTFLLFRRGPEKINESKRPPDSEVVSGGFKDM